jgi:hypothetical protein
VVCVLRVQKAINQVLGKLTESEYGPAILMEILGNVAHKQAAEATAADLVW